MTTPFTQIYVNPGPKGAKGDQGIPGTSGLGWIFLQDSQYTDASPLFVPAGVKTLVPDNTQGILSSRVNAPASSVNWYNMATGKFKPDCAGDFFIYRLNLRASMSVNNKTLNVLFDIGTANPLFADSKQFNNGAGFFTQQSFILPIGFGGSAAALAGGGIYLNSQVDAMISGITILVEKVSGIPL